MKYNFEAYMLGDSISKVQWDQLYRVIQAYGGTFGKFEVLFSCKDNIVRYFISSSKDLSVLSNSIDGMLLRHVAESELNVPDAKQKKGFTHFAANTNMLDLKERYSVKKSTELQFVKFSINAITKDKAIVRAKLVFVNPNNHTTYSSKLLTAFPSQLLAVDFENNTRYLKKIAPKYLNIEKSIHMLSSDRTNALFSIDAFPYFSHNYYLSLSGYEFDKHSFIMGSSGSGKSKLIELLVDRLIHTAAAMNYRIVVIDPHATLEHDLRDMPGAKIVNFGGESAQLFPKSTADVSAATELTTTLLLSLMSATPSTRLERLLRFSLFVLFVGQCMSLPMLKNFLNDLDTRNQLLTHVKGYVPDNILLFFGSEYNEIRTQHYAEALSPIIALVDEMQLQPALLGDADRSLNKTIQDNFLTVFSLNKVAMGEKVVKTVAGLLIQQIFLLAQARVFGQRVILVIDEVSVVQNPALASILAEARKFNLTVMLSQQYFGQIEKDLRDAILSNVVNYYIFKISEEDARSLEANLTIDIPKEILEEGASRGLKEADVRTKLMTELHPRECLIRVASGGQILPCIKGRTVDAPLRVADALGSRQHNIKPYAKQQLPSEFVPSILSTPTPIENNPTPLERPPVLVPNIENLLKNSSSSRRQVSDS